MKNEFPADDSEFEEHTLKKVDSHDDGYTLCLADGGCLFVSKPTPIEPRAGHTARFYGRGFGYPVRGVFVDGQRLYYRTEAEDRERHRQWVDDLNRKKLEDFEANREATDARVADMPEFFQRRLTKFREANPNFRWDREPYELFCCEQAVEIAKHVKAEDIGAFHKLDFSQQQMIVPGLSDGHSGNTFGASCRLAYHYLTEPENVVREHGALSPLVGCEAYGCPHPGTADVPVEANAN